MPQKKHKPEEILARLRQVDVLMSRGQSVAEAVGIERQILTHRCLQHHARADWAQRQSVQTSILSPPSGSKHLTADNHRCRQETACL